MRTTYHTTILGFGNHASIEIPQSNLDELDGSKRSPLKITIKDYTYQSTATVMNGTCMVVFPMRDREAAGVNSGETVKVTLELDNGYRKVDMPEDFSKALEAEGLTEMFKSLTHSKRKELARAVTKSKASETKARHISKIVNLLKSK